VFAKIASDAPRERARSRATTFSAYEVVLAPAVADLSLRVQGTVITLVVSGHSREPIRATTTVGRACPRSLPSGERPPVTVMRSLAGPAIATELAKRTSAIAPLRVSMLGSSSPRTAAEFSRRRR
jgi:hypothetical protein